MNTMECTGLLEESPLKLQFSKEWKNAADTPNSQKKLEISDFFKHFNLSPFFGRGLSFKGKKWL